MPTPSIPSSDPSLFEHDSLLVDVALDVPVDRLFTYRVPDALRDSAALGHRVVVPFRGRRKTGIVAGTPERTELKRVLSVQSAPDATPVLGASLRSLARFIARYYGCGVGEAMAAMVPRGVRVRAKKTERWHVSLVPHLVAGTDVVAPPKHTPAQMRILRMLRRLPDGLSLAELCRQTGVSSSPVKTLERSGWVSLAKRAPDDRVLDSSLGAMSEGSSGTTSEAESIPPTLTDEQAVAVSALTKSLAASEYAAYLLHGVTGSGKTEVYLRALATCIEGERQAIVLVPEIALTPQTVRRFRARFDRVAVLHSGMTEATRAREWKAIRAGGADVVIGPRSAIFAPVPRLGLVVVDEEHETTFKQQSTPRYHARDVALVRAREEGAVVVLGSATPSLETFHHVEAGKYALLSLPRRVGNRSMPRAKVIDLRDPDERPRKGSHFSRSLKLRMAEALRERTQVILFQNRRGYATSVSCTRCGHVVTCPHCDLSLTYHKIDRAALCHLCGFEQPVPNECPDCALPGMQFQGAGTQTVEDELSALYPDARVARMDSDTMTTRDAYIDVLRRFGDGDIDILVGTQMIAKGLDFPNVSLVGIVSADTSLSLPDFRSGERTFQLIAQVAGRAGRGDVDGRVVIQTRTPDHPAVRLAALHDYASFAVHELEDREAFGYPPYRRLLRVVVLAPTERAADDKARQLSDALVASATSESVVIGPAVPPVARVKGRHRRHILVKARSHKEVASLLAMLRRLPRRGHNIDVVMDVDPQGLS